MLGLLLAGVAGAHLWALQAWSQPVAPQPLARPGPVSTAMNTRTLALLAPPLETVPPAAVRPSVAAERPAPVVPPSPRPQRTTRPAATPTAPAPKPPALAIADTPEPPTHDAAEPALLLTLAAPGAGPARMTGAPAATMALTAPPSARLRYRLSRGLLVGTGQLDWQRDAGSYRMRLEARVGVIGQIFAETSEGRLDDGGLAPLRHTERRLKRSERAVSFVRDQGPPRILFSAREGDEPLQPGAQDRLSWIAQLATRLSAPPAGEWQPGHRIEMDVASTGGDVQHWVFTVQEQDGATGLWHLRREPDSPRDTRAEVWTDPRRHHWPVRLQLREPFGEPLELTLEGQQPAS